jgi:uncharacterized protein YjbJ (UPF0337 family)
MPWPARPPRMCRSGHPPRQDDPRRASHPVSIAKKFAHKAEAVKGSLKRTAGRLTGSRRLRAKGRRDRFKGNMKQAGAKVKDAVKH